ncbi:MAG TPA: bifunctional phosphoribosylaminoimidazolecarboxamide formyltransferase/IMP cyclohydrolase [Thermomicrobiales bacterium]|jgi:phosphoribosylaminoimidazolecarboxamide formyltransferase/IMP cyclohydrolase|nr:bifunctional phosphoribosylaminoimidazolecarboxamide formyltransferase/IMP cyclohydrolase [Thermomicrobiales bacterium]
MRALLSVSNKRDVIRIGQALADHGYELISTGGTASTLAAAGLPVLAVSEITGFPEIMDGRVKTLHPAIHGGLLARRDVPADIATLEQHGIVPIDVVVANLYPFAQTIARDGTSFAEAIENIDIGGPAMIRAAAKNHGSVLVITSPDDYEAAITALAAGTVDANFRRQLAARAFAHVAAYDTLIAEYLRGEADLLPAELSVAGRRTQVLRYGENPHQRGAAYRRAGVGPSAPGILDARQLAGKELSYNNLLDADAAIGAIRSFSEPAVSIIKHTIPCGLATRPTLLDAYAAALAGDPVSAFGGIVAMNRELDGDTAAELGRTFYEIVIAPSFAQEALEALRRKTSLRLLELPALLDADRTWHLPIDVRPIAGGLLVQESDTRKDDDSSWTVATKRQPTEREWADIRFAWEASRHIKSNAIVIAKDNALLGMGSGQPNRLESVGIASRRAGARAVGAALASDAFFPFADGVERALESGVTAIVQPGGSVRDAEVIAAVDAAGATMVFTGTRHFRH